MNIQKTTISNDPEKFEAWPDIALANNGNLLVVFAECKTHLDRSYTRVMLCESSDRGRTWSHKRPVTPATTEDEMFYNCPRIVTLKDGRMCLIVDRNLHGMKAETTPQSEVVLFFSEDNGKTWGEEVKTPIRGIVPDKLIELDTGRWIISTHYLVEQTGKLEQYLWFSDDNGKTWSDRITVAANADYNLCEATLLPLGNGKVVAFLRENSGRAYDCMKTISNDNGETWSDIVNFPLPGCHRPVSGFLKDGRILLTYRFAQGGKGWPGNIYQNLFGAFFNVESALTEERNDTSVRIFPIDYDRSVVADTGYSGHVQFDNGEIYVVNYIIDDADKGQIRGYSFLPEDFLISETIPV